MRGERRDAVGLSSASAFSLRETKGSFIVTLPFDIVLDTIIKMELIIHDSAIFYIHSNTVGVCHIRTDRWNTFIW